MRLPFMKPQTEPEAGPTLTEVERIKQRLAETAAELETAEAELDRLAGGIVLVTGMAGAGKTALTQALASAASGVSGAVPNAAGQSTDTTITAIDFMGDHYALIDTPGAYPGMDAEERGQAQAIAESIQLLFNLTVPTLAVVIGVALWLLGVPLPILVLIYAFGGMH